MSEGEMKASVDGDQMCVNTQQSQLLDAIQTVGTSGQSIANDLNTHGL